MKTVPAKTIVTRTKSTSWFGTQYNMNIYRGCCHGCIYCDSRSACYGVEDFDRVRVKENALETIARDLRRKVRPGVVGTGAMSDPYNPFERELELTRHGLELLDAYGFGVAVATKSDLVVRDVDILTQIAEHSPVLVKMTVTAADDELCRKVEPYVCPSSQRFAAIRALSDAGIFTGVLLMPVLPFLEDNEENIGQIIAKAQESGARFLYPAFGMTLRYNQREWYLQQLEKRFPGQGLRRRYEQTYGERYRCVSPKERQLWKFFRRECDERGLLYRMQDIIRAYQLGYGGTQLSFFD